MDDLLGDKQLGKRFGWQLLKASYLYSNDWFKLRQDTIQTSPEEVIVYTYVEHPGSVLIVPITPNGRMILIKSYRYTIDEMCWEIPAGSLSDGLAPEEMAVRELREEIGGQARRVEPLGTYFIANGIASLRAYVFIAHGVTFDEKTAREPGELIDQVKDFSLVEVINMIMDGMVSDSDSAFALMLAITKLRIGERSSCD